MGQNYFYDEIRDEYYNIHAGADAEIIEKYLQEVGGVNIAFDTADYLNYGEDNAFKVQFPDGKWRLYSLDYSTDNQVVNKTPYDSIGFLDPAYYLGFTIVKDEGKYGFLFVWDNTRKKDNVKFEYEAIGLDKLDLAFEYREIEILDVYVKQNGKWGKVKIGQGDELIPHTEIKYDLITDIPENGFLPEKKFGKKHKIEWFEPIDEYYWKARGKNGKWGLFMGEGEVYQIVPMEFDSLQYYDDRQVTATWLNGKVGYYNASKQVKPTEYDDFEFIFIDYDYTVGLKKDNKWQMYDSFSGEFMFEGKADTPEELLDKWLYRNH